MSEKKIRALLKNNKKIIDNPFYLENIWYIDKSSNFDEKMAEFYPPDIWFIGKNQIFEKEISKAIDKAKELIVVCSFLIQETEITDALLKAAKKGVRIYILTASEQRLDKDQGKENETENERIEDHKKLLRTLKTKCFIRTAQHFHAKYVIIDPKNESRTGYLSSANFTQHALKNNLEISIKLNEKQIIDLFNTFCHVFWYQAEHESLSRESLRSVKNIDEHIFDKPKNLNIFGAKQDIDFKTTLEKTIEETTGPIHLCTYSIDQTTSLFESLIKQLQKGRKIHLYTRPRKKDIEPLARLKENGAQIKGHRLLHMKGMFIEDNKKPVGMIFTGNLTSESFDNSYDVGIFLSRDQYKTILPIIKSWNEIIPLTFFSNIRIKNLKVGKYLRWEKEKELFQIEENETINIGEIKIERIRNIKDFESKLKIPDSMKFKAKKFTFTWTIKVNKNKKPKLKE